MIDKKYLFIGGCGRSGTSVLTQILGSHTQIVLGLERYNKIMKKNFFSLTQSHFEKERFINIREGDTFYNDFKKFQHHHNIPEKWDEALIFGVKYPPFERIYKLMKNAFGNFSYVYIYRNIYDVAESWNDKVRRGGRWKPDKNYLKAVDRWNNSLKDTLKYIELGENIICLNYEDLLFTQKPINRIFDLFGIKMDQNVENTLAIARAKAPKKKSKKGKLSPQEFDYVNKNAHIELFHEFNKKYNILS
ncbi:MAG: sulfotransferase [Bacteroidota bacterium]|nr:sulfotransferase [Bacteroidota bacterium]